MFHLMVEKASCFIAACSLAATHEDEPSSSRFYIVLKDRYGELQYDLRSMARYPVNRDRQEGGKECFWPVQKLKAGYSRGPTSSSHI